MALADVTEIKDQEYVVLTNCKHVKLIDCELVDVQNGFRVMVADSSDVRLRRSFIVEIRDCLTGPSEIKPLPNRAEAG